jgi:hypothetical protein
MSYRFVVPLIFALTVSGTATGAAIVTNITTDDSLNFVAEIIGGDFDSDETHVIPPPAAVNWFFTVNISEDAGFVNDVLSINGSLRHKITPPAPAHGEGANAAGFVFNFLVDADDFPEGANHPKDKFSQVSHINHNDWFLAKLDFTVSSTIGFDDITGYVFTIEGHHTDSGITPPPLRPSTPEPSSVATLALGILILGIHGRKRRLLVRRAHM